MQLSERNKAILSALFVTMLWSSSWVLIKTTLNDIPPLTFAGLRYSIAFLALLPGLIKRKEAIKNLSKKQWLALILLGVVNYAINQGGQFLAMDHLEATTLSLILNFSAPLVAVFGLVFLREGITRLQWFGIGVFLLGVLLYFIPQTSGGKITVIGMVFALITVLSTSVGAVQARGINREKNLDPFIITGISMGIGAILLLGSGVTFQGLPPISGRSWAVLLFLGLSNSAFAFVVWNRSLRVLSAMESNIINNTMLIQIAILAWIFLGEKQSWLGIIGLVFAGLGTLLVNLKPKAKEIKEAEASTQPEI